MVEDSSIATHSDPAWRDRTNFIARLHLGPYDMPGRWEQCWTHTEDQRLFEMCCIPFFAYGISLGDTLSIDRNTGAHQVLGKSGHRTIRFAFVDNYAAHHDHDRVHETLAGRLGCLVEFHGTHYAAIDLANANQGAEALETLTPLSASGKLTWEWADPEQSLTNDTLA